MSSKHNPKGDTIMTISATYMIESKNLIIATPASIIDNYTTLEVELGTDFINEFKKLVINKLSKISWSNMEEEYPFEEFMTDAVDTLIESAPGTESSDAEDQITWLNDDFTNLYDLINKAISGTSKFYIVDTDLCDPIECIEEMDLCDEE